MDGEQRVGGAEPFVFSLAVSADLLSNPPKCTFFLHCDEQPLKHRSSISTAPQKMVWGVYGRTFGCVVCAAVAV